MKQWCLFASCLAFWKQRIPITDWPALPFWFDVFNRWSCSAPSLLGWYTCELEGLPTKPVWQRVESRTWKVWNVPTPWGVCGLVEVHGEVTTHYDGLSGFGEGVAGWLWELQQHHISPRQVPGTPCKVDGYCQGNCGASDEGSLGLGRWDVQETEGGPWNMAVWEGGRSQRAGRWSWAASIKSPMHLW